VICESLGVGLFFAKRIVRRFPQIKEDRNKKLGFHGQKICVNLRNLRIALGRLPPQIEADRWV
jgi:hypothetical protein